MKKIEFKDIPDDLDELLEESDIMYTGSSKFDDAMIAAEFFEYGTIRRSHRVVTDKARIRGLWGIIEELTGVPHDVHVENLRNEAKAQEIHDMFETAKKYGYTITKDVE